MEGGTWGHNGRVRAQIGERKRRKGERREYWLFRGGTGRERD